MKRARVCQKCQQAYYEGGGYKYCSDACSKAAKDDYQAAYRKTYIRKRPQLRPRKINSALVPRHCKYPKCSAAFMPTDPKQRYCCRQCSVKMRARSAAQERLSKARRFFRKHGLL